MLVHVLMHKRDFSELIASGYTEFKWLDEE